jgi:hypothetical protein
MKLPRPLRLGIVTVLFIPLLIVNYLLLLLCWVCMFFGVSLSGQVGQVSRFGKWLSQKAMERP